MHFLHDVVLLLTAIIFANVDAVPMVTNPNLAKPGLRSITRSFTENQTNRFLRTRDMANAGIEERRITILGPKTFFTSSKVSQKTIERWIKNGKSPDAFFVKTGQGKE